VNVSGENLNGIQNIFSLKFWKYIIPEKSVISSKVSRFK